MTVWKSYTITLFNAGRVGVAKSHSIMREHEWEAVDAAERGLRSHRNTTGEHALYDSWSVMVSPGRNGLPQIVASGGAVDPLSDGQEAPQDLSDVAFSEAHYPPRGPSDDSPEKRPRTAWEKLAGQ